MQFDGNLVLYVIDDGNLPPDITQGQYIKALWQSHTVGVGFTCEMQDDGNLVVYNEARGANFATNTENHPGAFLRCQDDGNLVVYGPQGALSLPRIHLQGRDSTRFHRRLGIFVRARALPDIVCRSVRTDCR